MSLARILFGAASVALLLMAAAPAQGGRVRIDDGHFVATDWQLSTLFDHPDIHVTIARRADGGNPGPFRVIRHAMPAATDVVDPHVVSLHRYLGASYDIAREGAIRAICYEEDSFVLDGFGEGQGRGMALWQDGRAYAAPIAPTGMPADWFHMGPTVFVQDDFYEVLPGATRDRSSHPDFSSRGGPIDVGFLRTNTTRSRGFLMVGAIDNWAVEINCAAGGAPPSDPATIYLPLTLRERCPPVDLYADIALVLDASTTMLERSSSGRRKIDVAVDATRDFLDGLRLRPGGDRVSLVTFNSEVVTLSPLTNDRNALDQALDQVDISQQSRIDLGLQRGAESLTAARPASLHALVLLSDGLANPAPASEVLAAADRARASGITLYAVGLGPRMEEPVLRAIAGDPKRYFPAEDPELLGAIYTELARRVPCPPSAYWGRR